ncbi:hypothetical protein HK405_013821 [Cladochytrium tenue]|nr:hypothetical protein HK405_013821 [Cladochytrium tenue]
MPEPPLPPPPPAPFFRRLRSAFAAAVAVMRQRRPAMPIPSTTPSSFAPLLSPSVPPLDPQWAVATTADDPVLGRVMERAPLGSAVYPTAANAAAAARSFSPPPRIDSRDRTVDVQAMRALFGHYPADAVIAAAAAAAAAVKHPPADPPARQPSHPAPYSTPTATARLPVYVAPAAEQPPLSNPPSSASLSNPAHPTPPHSPELAAVTATAPAGGETLPRRSSGSIPRFTAASLQSSTGSDRWSFLPSDRDLAGSVPRRAVRRAPPGTRHARRRRTALPLPSASPPPLPPTPSPLPPLHRSASYHAGIRAGVFAGFANSPDDEDGDDGDASADFAGPGHYLDFAQRSPAALAARSSPPRSSPATRSTRPSHPSAPTPASLPSTPSPEGRHAAVSAAAATRRRPLPPDMSLANTAVAASGGGGARAHGNPLPQGVFGSAAVDLHPARDGGYAPDWCLPMNIGDPIVALETYADGLAFGVNLATRRSGLFPLIAVAFSTDDDDVDDDDDDDHQGDDGGGGGYHDGGHYDDGGDGGDDRDFDNAPHHHSWPRGA